MARKTNGTSSSLDGPQRTIGNYCLIRQIGQGGFADVYLGRHVHLSTLAAIKLLRVSSLSLDAMKRFRHEAQLIAALSHPHIIRVLDFGFDEKGQPYLIMEYAPHGSLRHYYPKGSRLPLVTIASLVQQIASALDYAHQHKLVHRDIKPDNLLLGPEKQVLLADFGLALVTETQQSSSHSFSGTLAYMAPEHIQGHPQAASDQYALGVLVYEWITGVRPFLGTLAELATQHLTQSPLPLTTHVPDLPLAIERVVERALEKEPQQRFATAGAFAAAFEQALTQAPSVMSVPARSRITQATTIESTSRTAKDAHLSKTVPPTRHSPLPTRSHQRRKLVSLLALGILSTLGGGILYAALQPHVSPHPSTLPESTTPVPPTPTSPPQTQMPSPTPTAIAPPAPGTTLIIYRGHNQPVSCLSCSPDGTRIASGSLDTTIQIWQTANGTPLLTYRGHRLPVTDVAWSPDGTTLASSSGDGLIHLWNATTGTLQLSYHGHAQPVSCLTFSPDGTRIASGDLEGQMQVWNVTTGTVLTSLTSHGGTTRSLAFSPDGTQIVSCEGDMNVYVWNVTRPDPTTIYQGHSSIVSRAAWSPDGTLIASASADSTVRLWETTTGTAVRLYLMPGQDILDVAWSPDGTTVACSCQQQHQVLLWDTRNGEQRLSYRGHKSPIARLAWSPNGSRIASASFDQTVRLWQTSKESGV